MARTPAFRLLQRCMNLAEHCRRTGMPADEAIEQSRESHNPRRRELVLGAAAAATLAHPLRLRAQSAPSPAGSVAIVGAGLAGLYASLKLTAKGRSNQVYEAGSRIGGRVWSLRGVFPGQVIERGGEVIDTEHRLIRSLVTEYGLTLEDHSLLPGAQYFYVNGQRYTEAQVIDEYNAFSPIMKADLNKLSNSPSALSYTAYDRQLDLMTLSDYLSSRQCPSTLRAVLDAAYTTEFGREIDRQSSLAMLFYSPAKRFNKAFRVLGSSDERFHIVEGNDALVQAMNTRLERPVALENKLIAVARLASGRLRLSFQTPAGVVDRVHDAAILTLPAPMMREVQLDSSLGLPAASRQAIAYTDYGSNSKLMLGFVGRPWIELQNCNGITYANLPDLQTTWETNPSAAINGQRGTMVDFTGGRLGERLGVRNGAMNDAQVQTDAGRFASDLDKILPGCLARARMSNGKYLVHVENWLLNPLTKGAYTNNQPGYFTGVEGLYSQTAGNLVFAGEHTDSFYNFQGFMEGALMSGQRAATQVAAMV